MERSRISWKVIALCLLPVLAMLFWQYWHIISDPNGTLFAPGADALKNYYTPWYHVKFDESYTWFQGMNFPYGDHIVFADAQPLVSNILKFISQTFVDLSNWVPAILHLLMLGSILLCAWYVFLILRFFHVEERYAALAAVVIALLSPQIHRMAGHYALAYACFVPMIWYLWLRYFQSPNWLRTLRIALVIFAFAWIHPYYLMIGGLFGIALWFFYFLRNRREKPWTFYLNAFTQIILPLILFQVILQLSDPVTDRPDSPWGHEAYNSNLKTILFPMYVPGQRWMISWLGGVKPGQWEGAGYIGLFGTLFLLLVLYRLGQMIPKRGLKRIKMSRNPLLAISLAAGLLMLVLAMGFPFSIEPEFTTRLFPPIKQFRSMGRFVWVFYYVWTVFAAYGGYLILRKLKGRGLKNVTLIGGVVVLAFSLYEASQLNRYVASKARDDHFKKWKQSPSHAWWKDLDSQQYSALLVLPFFHVGSENLSAHSPEGTTDAFLASLETGLPLLNCNMSRTSFDQSWQLLQFAGEDYRFPELYFDLPHEKRLLIMDMGGSVAFMGEGVLRNSEVIYRGKGYRVLEWDMGLWGVGAPEIDSIDSAPLVWRDFDENATQVQYHGPGAYRLSTGREEVLFRETMDVRKGDTLLFSLWVRMRRPGLPVLHFQIGEEDGLGALVRKSWSFANDLKVVLDGDWALLEKEWVVGDPGNRIVACFKPLKGEAMEYWVDELTVSRRGQRVSRLRGDYFMVVTGIIRWVEVRRVPLTAIPFG